MPAVVGSTTEALASSKGASDSALRPIKLTVLRRLETTERARLARERPTFRQELAAFLATVEELEGEEEAARPSRRLRHVGL